MKKYYVSYQFQDSKGEAGYGCLEYKNTDEYKLKLTFEGIKEFAEYLRELQNFKRLQIVGIIKLEE